MIFFPSRVIFTLSPFNDIRYDNVKERRRGNQVEQQQQQRQQHNIERVRVGKIVVPIFRNLKQRDRMYEKGVYPGVEYRILRIIYPPSNDDNKDDNNDKDIFTSVSGAYYDIMPIYNLIPKLERQWPVRVNEKNDIPKLITPVQYNLISAIGSLLTATIGLGTAFLISQAISFFYIPSKSMDPTLKVGDVLLVDKITPKVLPRNNNNNNINDIVLFSPPEALRDIVRKNGGKISDRDLFVKRIAAVPGDTIDIIKTTKPKTTLEELPKKEERRQQEEGDGMRQSQRQRQQQQQQSTSSSSSSSSSSFDVFVNGKMLTDQRNMCDVNEPLRLIEKYVQPTTKTSPIQLKDSEYFVLGDCDSVSIDSRVWGPLNENDIKGRPIIRLWPLNRFGMLSSLPEGEKTTEMSETDWK